MQVKVDWQDNVHFVANNDNGHTVVMDGPPEQGRQQVEGSSISIHAERADTFPAVFEAVDIHFHITGNALDPAKMQRAIELSAQKYRSASIMLDRAGVVISHSFELQESA